jgi:hypothetical protein
MMTPYEVVKEHIHERMISAKLASKMMGEAFERGNFEDVLKWADNIRDNLNFSGFERQVFVTVQAANNSVNRTQEGAAS